MDNKKKSFEDLMRETFGAAMQEEVSSSDKNGDERFPLCDNIDTAIIMHRDVHFKGNFTAMIDYYQRGGKGAQPAFTVERLRQLQALEAAAEQDLIEILLAPSDLEKMHEALEAYQKLRSVYEQKEQQPSPHLKLLANLILTEEEEAHKEVQAVVNEGRAIVPRLLQLIQSPEFHDPLWPGYGLAPELAAKCLGHIGDSDAIVNLFEAIEDYDFFGEDTVFRAFKHIGEPAKQFLLGILEKTPPTRDSERAARALIYFSPDEEVAKCCLNLLQMDAILNMSTLATYLVLNCAGLQSEEDRLAFLTLAQHNKINDQLQRDIKSVASEFTSRE